MGRNPAFRKDRRPEAGEMLEDSVRGWYRMLTGQLARLASYLVPGRIVTFQHITPEEQTFFQDTAASVRVPDTACAVFIPPSVVQQAMWPDAGAQREKPPSELYGIAPDAGAIAAQRCGSLSVVVNALFTFPPLAPGVDVYEQGRLLAGYTYNDHQECADGLSGILATHLGR